MENKNLSKAKRSALSLYLGFVPVITAIISIISLLVMPYAKFKFKSKSFKINGFGLVTGATVEAKGKTMAIPVSPLAVILLVASIVVIICAFVALKKRALAFEIITVVSIVAFYAVFKLATGMSKSIPDAKSVTAASGVIIPIVMLLITIVIGMIELKDNKVLSALDFMCMPGMLYLLINNYIPMFGIYIAFKKVDYSKGLWNSDWVGFKNFQYLFQSSDAFIITRNTLLYNVAFIVLGLITGCIAGIALAELFSKFMQKFYQTLILLPQLISMVIVSYIVYGFLSNESGLITKMLLRMGTEINFYATPKVWPFIIIFVYIWKQIGYNAIVFLSSIVGIDRSLYEAGRVDGATKWQQIFRITIPQLKPTIMTLFILQVGRIFYSDFGLFYQVPLDAGALYNVTNTVDTYVYRALLVNNNISTASAASTYQAVVGFIIVFAVNMIIRKVDRENAMF